ncbi:MAG: AbrB/MazE/SpoVT family DNA-binding domain-containing protein [Actinomycetota bacterium]|nr:AbrB/MazE/SpoVT family DNA-binding domain-containing protein [Actinomycetota bacterium]
MPKAVRDDLGAKPGDEFEFEPAAGGYLVRHRRRRSILDFAGIAADSAHRVPETAEDLDELIAREWTESAVRKLQKASRRSASAGR